MIEWVDQKWFTYGIGVGPFRSSCDRFQIMWEPTFGFGTPPQWELQIDGCRHNRYRTPQQAMKAAEEVSA